MVEIRYEDVGRYVIEVDGKEVATLTPHQDPLDDREDCLRVKIARTEDGVSIRREHWTPKGWR